MPGAIDVVTKRALYELTGTGRTAFRPHADKLSILVSSYWRLWLLGFGLSQPSGKLPEWCLITRINTSAAMPTIAMMIAAPALS